MSYQEALNRLRNPDSKATEAALIGVSLSEPGEHLLCHEYLQQTKDVATVLDGMGWQPIETAPKDGTPILVWHPLAKCSYTVSWDYDSECWRYIAHTVVTGFTHWQPLPPAPALPVGGKGETK